MTYDATEKSLYDAQPIELYHFDGTLEDWYITTAPDTITSGGQDYTPVAALKRSSVKVSNQEEDQLAIDIEIPFDHPIATSYAYRTAPPSLIVNIYRAHRNDPNDTLLLWKGRVLSFSVTGRICKLRVPAIFSYLLQGVAPAPRYQAPCNHMLYDARCGVNPAGFQHVATVGAIVDNIVTLDGLGVLSAGELPGGEMIWATGGENRMMISASGLDVTVAYPFANLAVGQNVTIRRGCDHSFTECKAVFSNGANFGGCPLVPGRNPFTSKP